MSRTCNIYICCYDHPDFLNDFPTAVRITVFKDGVCFISIHLLSKCYRRHYFIHRTFETKMSSSNPLFSTDRTRVLMTGFSPFMDYDKNPSWEGLHFMNADKIERRYNITLFRKEIPVDYKTVDEKVPQMWYWYQPHLTIHVGLDEDVECLVLQKCAKKQDYKSLVSCSKNIQNPAAGSYTVETDLDIEEICREFNSRTRKLPDPALCAIASNDAGRNVGEYTYYTSLCQRQSPTLLVHVPNKLYSREQLARGLERILELCLKQLPKHNTDDDN